MSNIYKFTMYCHEWEPIVYQVMLGAALCVSASIILLIERK